MYQHSRWLSQVSHMLPPHPHKTITDASFRRVREAYGLEARPTAKEVRERGESWRPYRTFATWYMWGVRRLAMGIVARERTRIVSL